MSKQSINQEVMNHIKLGSPLVNLEKAIALALDKRDAEWKDALFMSSDNRGLMGFRAQVLERMSSEEKA